MIEVVPAVLTAACVVPYLCDIRHGSTRPHRVSWFVFAVLSVIATVSQALEGATSGAWLTAGSAFGFGLVFVVSIRSGVGGSSRQDRAALGIAIVGVVASVVVDRPVVAIVAVVVAEIAAVSLTVQKARHDPASETMSTWIVDGLAGAVAIVAAPQCSVIALLYPVHHVAANGWVVLAIVRGRRSRGGCRDRDWEAV